MTKDEALKMALKALEKSHTCPLLPDDCAEAITAIKEALMSVPDGAQPEQDWIERERAVGYREGHQNALKQMAQPEQEPVACDGDFPEGFDASLGVPAQALRIANSIMCDVIGKREWDVPCTAQHVLSFAKKYTTPPQPKPLTDEEIQGCWYRTQGEAEDFARAIEAAHGIKEIT